MYIYISGDEANQKSTCPEKWIIAFQKQLIKIENSLVTFHGTELISVLIETMQHSITYRPSQPIRLQYEHAKFCHFALVILHASTKFIWITFNQTIISVHYLNFPQKRVFRIAWCSRTFTDAKNVMLCVLLLTTLMRFDCL